VRKFEKKGCAKKAKTPACLRQTVEPNKSKAPLYDRGNWGKGGQESRERNHLKFSWELGEKKKKHGDPQISGQK